MRACGREISVGSTRRTTQESTLSDHRPLIADFRLHALRADAHGDVRTSARDAPIRLALVLVSAAFGVAASIRGTSQSRRLPSIISGRKQTMLVPAPTARTFDGGCTLVAIPSFEDHGTYSKILFVAQRWTFG